MFQSRPEATSHAWRLHTALVLSLLVSSCGTTSTETRIHHLGTDTEWRTMAPSGPVVYRLGNPRQTADALNWVLQEQQTEQAWAFDRLVQQSRDVQDPNLLALPLGVMTLGAACLDGECFGKSGHWQHRESEVRRSNFRPTGETRTSWVTSQASLTWTAVLHSIDAGGRVQDSVKRVVTSAGGQLTVPVKSWAQTFSQRPRGLLVELTNGLLPGATTVRLDDAATANLTLFAEHWLTTSELYEHLSGALARRLRANEHTHALELFARIDKLPVKKTESFHYFYARSLAAVGKRSEARAQATQYLSDHGNSGKYVAQARELAQP